MKVRAIWRKKNFNPFWVGHAPPADSFYKKEVEVPDDCDMDKLKSYAEADSMEGYEFSRFEIMDQQHSLTTVEGDNAKAVAP